ncbi:MAG: peptidase domain-containing ABC transporter [Bacillota bacterium]
MNNDEVKQLLDQTSLLSVLKEDEVAGLAEAFEKEKFQLGRTVCKAGEPGEAFYVIHSGKARVVIADPSGKDVTLCTLSAGQHFGEQALLSGERWEFTVRAMGDLTVLKLPKQSFLGLFDKYPELKRYFQDYISDITLRTFIKQCTVFSPLSSEELRGLLDAFSPVSFSSGQYIFHEGGEGDSFYLIRSGELEVVKESLGDKIVNRLGKGDFFGELALITGAPRAAGIRANTEASLFRLDKADFDSLLSKAPQIKNSILGVAAGYSPAARDMLNGLGKDIPAGEPAAQAQTTVEPEPLTASTEPEEAKAIPMHSHKRRFPVLLQQNEMDCGAASLAMICSYYGLNIGINRLREMANVTRAGATLYSLAEAAEGLGFQTRGLRTDLKGLGESGLPAIAHWEGYHYIVITKVTEKQVIVADPAVGIRKLSKEEFVRGWGGILLTLTPTAALKEVEPSRSTFARFLPFVTKHRPALVKVLVMSLIIQVIGLAIPIFTQNIVDKVLINLNVNLLNLMLSGMVVITLFQAVATLLRQYMLIFTAKHIDMSLMIKFYSHALGLPLKYFQERKVGDIISRFNENSKIRDLLTGTSLSVMLDFLTVVVYLAVMYFYNAKLFLLALLCIPLFIFLTLIFTPVMKRTNREVFQAGADVQSSVVESITGINTLKALAAEKPVRWKWEEKLEKWLNLQHKSAMLATVAESLGRILQTLTTAFVLWYGAKLALNGEISLGQLMAFNALLGSVTGPILRIVGLWDKLQEARVALERLNDVLEAELEPVKNTITLPQIRGQITLHNVTFRYEKEGNYILQNINLEIAPGQTVALVGRSGSGKTTLANLLLRLHQPNQGKIAIDGMDIRHVSPPSLRRQVGVVLQENFLFSGTIRENIAFGVHDASMQDVITAAMIAGAHEFISELPMGYETIIGERGMSLSGGQRQRIAIARALFSKPKILIMDEATSALDTVSEKIIQQNLDSILHDRTTIIIAHRLSTVRNADLIVVLDRGIIVEQGTHYELMEKKGLYFYLNSQQLQG